MSVRKPCRRATVVHGNWLEERLSQPWIKKSRDSGRKLRSGKLVCVPSVDSLLFILEIDNLSWKSVILLIFSTRSWEHPFQISI